MEALERSVADSLLPCTASEKETCQIVTKLATLKKVLLGSPFEIQEEPETYNQLSITNLTLITPPLQDMDSRRLQQYWELLEWLLTTHRCVGKISLKLSVQENTILSLLHSVCKNSRIESLTIADINPSAMSTVSAILPCLTNIKHLHILTSSVCQDAYIDPLCALLQASSSLKSLKLWDRISSEQMASTLITTLLRKPCLEELHFENLVSLHSDAHIRALQEYLCSTSVLKAFTVTMTNMSLQTAVLEGVLQNRSIEKLSLRFFQGTEESTAVVSRIIEKKSALRWLSIISDDELFGLHSAYDCWVTPLVHNDVLEEVTLSASMLHPTKWSEIFRALPTKQNLKKIYIFSTSSYSHLRWLCAELKQSGSEEKVYLDYFTGLGVDTELLQCKAILGADLSLLPTDDRLLSVVRQLPKCQHLRAFCMRIDSDHMRLSLALAEFLRSATALHTLDLRVRGGGSQQAQGQNPWWKVILDSISRSKSVEKLNLVMAGMSIQDSQNLADSVKKNTFIRELRFENTPQANNTAFFRRISRDIEYNYTLSAVEFWGGLDADGVSDWLAVKEAVWRNAGLVPRAARINQASHSDRYVTGALERVARYPALLDDVARSAKLDRAELAVLVRDRLLPTKSKNGFMRSVGVVKERVICHPTDDGRMQLDDLDEDCWSHVRRYLVTDDVKIDVVQADSV